MKATPARRLLATALALCMLGFRPMGAQTIPPPTGHVNDFANVIPADTRTRLEDLARRVRAATAGDIAIVTLPDLQGRPEEEVALAIGRQWRLGADSAIGSAARNAGVVILVVPKETSSDGSGVCRIEVGQGAEGFITDAMSGAMCRNAVPLFRQADYGGAVEQITAEVAGRFAREFGVTLEGAALPQPRQPASGGNASSLFTFLLVIFLVMLVMSRIGGGGRRRKRGCVGCLPIPIPMGGPPMGGGWHRGGGGFGGGGFGGGGFGGGGFGGFGGGGGFSGGGGGARW